MQELRKIKRKDLDEKKYSQALENALNYRIYAEVWYLDVVAKGNWECWVYGDYEVIMPIPYQKKLGFKFVIQPPYCQQLGVFYKEEISIELFRKFEQKLRQYRVRSYHFNEENTEVFQPEGEKRTNYVLDLNRSYEEIYKDYSKKRRADIRKSEKLGLVVKEMHDLSSYKETFFDNYSHLSNFLSSEFLINFWGVLEHHKKMIQYNLYDKEGVFLASQLFLISGNRRICLGFTRVKEIERHNSSAFGKDFLIRKLAGKDFYLDFEGSYIKKIADFMEGFNPKMKKYTHYQNFSFKFK